MNAILNLVEGNLGKRIQRTCSQMGLAVCRRGEFGPGEKSMMLLDRKSYRTLEQEGWLPGSGSAALVILEDATNLKTRVSTLSSGVMYLLESELDLLPMVLEGMLFGESLAAALPTSTLVSGAPMATPVVEILVNGPLVDGPVTTLRGDTPVFPVQVSVPLGETAVETVPAFSGGRTPQFPPEFSTPDRELVGAC